MNQKQKDQMIANVAELFHRRLSYYPPEIAQATEGCDDDEWTEVMAVALLRLAASTIVDCLRSKKLTQDEIADVTRKCGDVFEFEMEKHNGWRSESN